MERDLLDENSEESISGVQPEPLAQNLGATANSVEFEMQKGPLGKQDSSDRAYSPAMLNRVLRKENQIRSEAEKASLVEPRAQEMRGTSNQRCEGGEVSLVSHARPAVHDFLSEQHTKPAFSAAAEDSYRSRQPALQDELGASEIVPPIVADEASGQNMVLPSIARFGQSKNQRRRNPVLPFMVTSDRRASHELATQPDSTPSVQVTIGRIEIRAETPVAAGRKVERASSPVMGLDEYLRQKNTRGNR